MPEETSLDQVRYLSPRTPGLQLLVQKGFLSLGIDHRRPNQKWQDKPGSTHLLFYVSSGSLQDLPQKNSAYPGDILIIPSGFHKNLQAGPKGCTGCWFHLSRRDKWKSLGNTKPSVQHSDQCLLIYALVDSLLIQSLQTTGEEPLAIRKKGELLVSLITLDFPEKEQHLPPQDIFLLHKFHDMWREVSTSLDRKWSIKDLAKKVHLSESHLHREVLRLMNQTPMEMITRLRMEQATALLKTSTEKLSSIANQVGYKSAYAFSNAFLAYSGQRPGAFRKSDQPFN